MTQLHSLFTFRVGDRATPTAQTVRDTDMQAGVTCFVAHRYSGNETKKTVLSNPICKRLYMLGVKRACRLQVCERKKRA